MLALSYRVSSSRSPLGECNQGQRPCEPYRRAPRLPPRRHTPRPGRAPPDRASRMEAPVTTNRRTAVGGAVSTPGGSLLPDELLAASHRVAESRAKSARTLTRSRARRRILPTVVVTSFALVGAGLANAFVNSTIVPPKSAASTVVAAKTVSQNAANALTLARVSAALAADQRTLAALARSAAATRALAATSAGGSTSTASSSGAGVASLPSASAPVVATPAPAPAPVVHATTGASGAG
jgi:hypothetical protein